jgi:hypothetical protein
MNFGMWLRLIAGLCAASALLATPPEIFPLKDVRAGQRGVGKTVFSGTRVEDFQVEILGVLENLGPRRSIILAKLSGGPLASAGVMQGMSGSPVYIDGKLVGAVALSFPQSKEAIAGIRPIEDMLTAGPAGSRAIADAGPERGADAPGGSRDMASMAAARPPRARQYFAGDARLEEIATPVSFLGFTAETLERFAPRLRQLGLDPRQGISGGGNVPDRLGDPKQLQPGSMISVQLMSGDMSVAADGTITAIDGDRIYAFGHRFLDAGATDLPFASAEVLTLLPSTVSSFKISTARELMGTITSDRDTAVAGITGRRASVIPVELRVGANTYRMRVAQDRVMTPLLLQMALSSMLEATQRSIGAQTYSIRGTLDFDAGPVHIDDVYSGEVGVAALAAAGVASPLSYALQSGFDALKLKRVALEIAPVETRSQQQIVDLIAPRTARPGEDVELIAVLAGLNGQETAQRVRYHVPNGTPPGPVNLTIADATTINLIEYQAAAGMQQRTPEQVLALLNGLRVNSKAYIRIWRSEPSYTVEGLDLPDPPASLAMVLARDQSGPNAVQVNTRGAKMAELEVPGPAGFVVTGSKTIQIEVKE